MVAQNVSSITLTPSEVREILKVDNDQIISLCRHASIIPKRNNKGLTYFSYNEVKRLQEVQQANSSAPKQTQPQSLGGAVSSLTSSLDYLGDKISKNIMEILEKKIEALEIKLDEKLKIMNEISSQIEQYHEENEKLKTKIVEMYRENFHLKMELQKYEKIGFGLYKKYKVKDYTI